MQTIETRNINGVIYEVKKQSNIDSDIFHLFCNGNDESFSSACDSYFKSNYPQDHANIQKKCIEFLFEIATEIEKYLARRND